MFLGREKNKLKMVDEKMLEINEKIKWNRSDRGYRRKEF